GDDADPLRLGRGQGLDLRRLLLSAGVISFALVGLDCDRKLGLRDGSLLLRPSFGLAELALLDGRLLLATVGLDLLFGDLPGAELVQDLLDLVHAARRLACLR